MSHVEIKKPHVTCEMFLSFSCPFFKKALGHMSNLINILVPVGKRYFLC